MKVSNYRYYRNEQLEIKSIDSRLSVEEKKVRRYLMNYLIDNHEPFNLNNLEDIAFTLDMNVNAVKNLMDNLLSKNAMVSDQEKNINFIYPVSALETDHIISLSDGRKFYAMCALDAIGTSFTFKEDVTIKSKCSNTAKEINITIKDGDLTDYSPDDLHILHVDLNKNTDWSGNCWNIMNFFCTEKDYNEWVNSMDLDKSQIFCLNVHEALLVSKMLFSVTDI